MTSVPKYRWQFSLRWLLILTTILCGVFARVAYFRQRAVFHERKAERYSRMIQRHGNLAMDDLIPFIHAQHHRFTAYKYRRAMYRPWSIVYETPMENDPKNNRPAAEQPHAASSQLPFTR